MSDANADRPTLSLRTRLEPRGPATAVELTDTQVDELGGGRRAAVVVTVAGRSARLRLARMGGANLIGLSKAARAELGVEIGDDVDVQVTLDTAERDVEVPDALASALDDTGLRPAFDAWSYSRRKEAARRVNDAKKPETAMRRVDALIAELKVVSARKFVKASPETVFELIADPARQPEWDGNDNLADAATGQRVRAVGDTFDTVLTAGSVRRNHIVEFDEGRLIAWRPSEVDAEPPGHVWRWELELGTGGVTVIHTYDWSGLHDAAREVRARATTADRLLASIDRLAALAERDTSDGRV